MLLRIVSESNIFSDISIINKITNKYLCFTSENEKKVKHELTALDNKKNNRIKNKILLSPIKILNASDDKLNENNKEYNSKDIIKKIKLPKIINNIAIRSSSTEYGRKEEIEKMEERIRLRKLKEEKIKKLEELMKQKEIEEKEKKQTIIEKKIKLRKELEGKIQKNLEKKREKEDEEKPILFLYELKNQKEIERQKIYDLRKKLDIENKRREEKRAEEYKQISLELEKQRLERINQIEIQRQQIEELKRINEENEEKIRKENEDKINIIIDELKMKSQKRKEIELKENGLENEQLKHKYRLYLLNKLVTQYLKIYKSNNISEIIILFMFVMLIIMKIL